MPVTAPEADAGISAASKSLFLYVLYIRTTPEALWKAIIAPEFTRQYWFGMYPESEWRAGAPWVLRTADGRAANTGQVLAADPPRRLVLSWRSEMSPAMQAEGYSRVTMDLTPEGDVVKLSVQQEIGIPDSQMVAFCGGGWPMILSSLKTLLETGGALERTHRMPAGFLESL